MLTLRLPEPPSANRYWRHAKGRTYLSAEAKAYRIAVRAEYIRQYEMLTVAFPDGPLVVVLEWFRGRKAGDLDNRWKQVGDALNGLAYTDDSQIVEMHLYRLESPRKPYCVVNLSIRGQR